MPRFFELDETGKQVAKIVEDWAKWVLEILRNLMVVAFFSYAAEKTGRWYLSVLAAVAFFALYSFSTARITAGQFNLNEVKSGWGVLLRIALLIFVLFLTMVFNYGVMIALDRIVDDIAAVQKH